MESKQTAVEWLEQELKKIPFVDVKEVFERAKTMEKEQIEFATKKGVDDGITYCMTVRDGYVGDPSCPACGSYEWSYHMSQDNMKCMDCGFTE